MNKRLMLIMVAVGLMCVGMAQANVYVHWYSSWGFYAADGSTPLLGSDGSGQKTLAQLIWSEDNYADDADVGGLTTGDDVWLADFTVQEDSAVNNPETFDYYALFTATPDHNDGGARPDGGYIYARIFQDDTPAAGEWYFVGAVVAANDLNPGGEPPDPAQLYDINTDSENGNEIDEDWTGSNNGLLGEQVIPEPGTIGLFALGTALVGLRKRRNK
ncbi:MAG: PEP-CTERM sorting domain-containing protein [Lentisphaerae bacterium]|nr:PEP-CTERM sorting domain-containing protein [Lentisphaerota bacterium]